MTKTLSAKVVLALGTTVFAAAPHQPYPLKPPIHLVWGLPAAHKALARDVAFSPDGKTLATTGDGGVSLWDAASGKHLAQKQFRRKGVVWLTFIPGGKELACVAPDLSSGDLHFLDARTLKVRKTIEFQEENWLSFLTVSPDGATVVAISHSRVGGRLGAWDVRTGRCLWLHPPSPDGETPYRLAFGPTGQHIAVAVHGRNAGRLFSPKTGQEVQILPNQPARARSDVTALTYSKPAGLLASAFVTDAAILLWDLGGQPAGEIRYPGRWRAGTWPTSRYDYSICFAYHLAFSPDGKTLAAACADGFVRLFEVSSGGVRAIWESRVQVLAFSPDGRLLATLWHEPGDLSVYDWQRPAVPVRTGEAVRWWEMLGSRDAELGFRAVCQMVATPEAAVAVLGRRLQPAADEETRRVAALVADLDDDEFDKRQRAERGLEALGAAAEGPLRKALWKTESLDLRARLKRLLAKLEGAPSEYLRYCRAVEVLERLGTPQARRLLDRLAGGAPGAEQTADAAKARQRLRERR